jgi:orotidine-5'-phosphate decarboxylase
MQDLSDKLIVALDVDTLNEAVRLVDILYPTVKMFKVGSQLFTACGPEAVKMVGEKGAKVFLDLKFHDIPNTVRNVVITGTSLSCILSAINPGFGSKVEEAVTYPVFMMTVHTAGGTEMMRYAVESAAKKAKELNRPKPLIVGITVLTSYDDSLATIATVLERARSAKSAVLDGVVCSPYEAEAVRKECGKDFIIVTPGIRPKNYPADDQKRTATASEALDAGADYIVVGRPVVRAHDPLKAIKELS